MRVAIVNDMVMACEALRRVLITAPGIEIAWVARDGAEAVEKCAQDTPDVILMDLIMPVMDGVQATARIMAETPCAILVVTATVDGNASKVFEAMGLGALDAVNTPTLGIDGATEGGQELLDKIVTVGKLIGKPMAPVLGRQPTEQAAAPPLIVLGASTGGPKALAEVLAHLPADFDGAFVCVQHVNAVFANGFAAWLNDQIPLNVGVAVEGDAVWPGRVLIPATDDHLVMRRDRTLTYTPVPRDNPFRPSVDAFFSSVAEHWPRPGIAGILTGMGRDGAQGLLALREAGWHTVAQDEASSIIYGMPKAAAEIGAAVEILPVGEIGPALRERAARL